MLVRIKGINCMQEAIKKALLPVRSTVSGRLIRKKTKIDFAVIGFPKCATTSIHKTLENVTGVYMPSYEVQVPTLKRGWLSLPENKTILGVKNPNIIYESHNLLSLYKSNKDIKFVISMRNPSDWLFSFYQYRMLEIRNKQKWLGSRLKKNPEYRGISFDDVVYNKKSFLGVSISAGYFVDYLVDVFKWIPKENILIMMTEEIADNPSHAYSRLFKFLNIDDAKKTSGIRANDKNKLYERRENYASHLAFLDDVYAKKNKDLNLFLHKIANYENSYW